MSSEWQLRFDHGRQQRYLPDRLSVLGYVLDIGDRTLDKRFEVFAEGEPVRLADGTEAGRKFEFVEVLDLNQPGVREHVLEEFKRLSAPGEER